MSALYSLLFKDIIFVPLFGILTFIFVYQYVDRVIHFLEKKTFNQRDEMLRLFDLMFIETNKKKLTTLLLLTSFGLGLIFFFLLWPHFWLGLIFGGVMVVLGWSVPAILTKNLYEKRCGLLVDQMVDGLTIMANGIRSGLSITQAMERVVDNLANPISQEFNLVLKQIKFGQSIEESLIDLAVRVPRPDVQVFVTAVNILKETGGNMAENFGTIAFTIRERQKIEKKIEAMTAQGLMQGLIVSLVPIILILIFFAIDPSYIMPMFSTIQGLVMTTIMFALIIIGGLSIRKIVKIKV